jgi:hypothetical protein
MFFGTPIELFALILLRNVCYLMFINCDIGPSCLPRSDVPLLKNIERANVSIKIHNYHLSKLFSKG